jgi:hypothetical protein
VQLVGQGYDAFVLSPSALLPAAARIEIDRAVPGARRPHPDLHGFGGLARRAEGEGGLRAELRGQIAAYGLERGQLADADTVVAGDEKCRMQQLVQGPGGHEEGAGQAGQDQDPAQAQRHPAMAEQPDAPGHQ